jgi:hypothetical protein
MPVHSFSAQQLSRASPSTSFLEVVVDHLTSSTSQPHAPTRKKQRSGTCGSSSKQVRFLNQGDSSSSSSCRWSAYPTSSLARMRYTGEFNGGLDLPTRSSETDRLICTFSVEDDECDSGSDHMNPTHRQRDFHVGRESCQSHETGYHQHSSHQEQCCWSCEVDTISSVIRNTNPVHCFDSPNSGTQESGSEADSDTVASDCELLNEKFVHDNHDAALSEAIIATIEMLSVRAALHMSRPNQKPIRSPTYTRKMSLLKVLDEAETISLTVTRNVQPEYTRP